MFARFLLSCRVPGSTSPREPAVIARRDAVLGMNRTIAETPQCRRLSAFHPPVTPPPRAPESALRNSSGPGLCQRRLNSDYGTHSEGAGPVGHNLVVLASSRSHDLEDRAVRRSRRLTVLFPRLASVCVDHVSRSGASVRVKARTATTVAVCPNCRTPSRHKHSRDERR